MPDKRFDTRPKKKTTQVRAHTRTTPTGAIVLIRKHLRSLTPAQRKQAVALGELWRSKLKYDYASGFRPQHKDVVIVPESQSEAIMDEMMDDPKLGFVDRDYKWPDTIDMNGKLVEGELITDKKGNPMVAIHALNEEWFENVDPEVAKPYMDWHTWKKKAESDAYLRRKSYVADLALKMGDGEEWQTERPHEVFVLSGKSQGWKNNPDHPYFKHTREAQYFYNVPQEIIKDATPYKFEPKDRLGGLWKYGQRIVTLMDPADYLSMTTPIPLDKKGQPVSQESLKYIRKAYKSGKVWGSTPYIEVDENGRPLGAQHEGRHRAWVMMTEYPGQKIPVTIYNRRNKDVDGMTIESFFEKGYEAMDQGTRIRNLERAMEAGQLPQPGAKKW
jgi:hypothetical protein